MASPVMPSRLSELRLLPLLLSQMRSARLRLHLAKPLHLAKLELAGAGGIEPPLRGPKPRVLPLNDAPVPSSARPERRARIGPDRTARPPGPAHPRPHLSRVVQRPREPEHGRPAPRHDRSEGARGQEGRLHAAD